MKYIEINKTSAELNPTEAIVKSDAEDPFLCPKCQKHGYCIAKSYKHPSTHEIIPLPIEYFGNGLDFHDTLPISDLEISNIVNVRTNIKEATTKFGKKLQQAHDLFHQDEFEQASYMYQDIIETRSDISEAWRGICASFYFLSKYDEAVASCLNANAHLEHSFVNRFVKSCEKKMLIGEKRKEKQEYLVPHLIY